jgi:hypothetical protein
MVTGGVFFGAAYILDICALVDFIHMAFYKGGAVIFFSFLSIFLLYG